MAQEKRPVGRLVALNGNSVTKDRLFALSDERRKPFAQAAGAGKEINDRVWYAEVRQVSVRYSCSIVYPPRSWSAVYSNHIARW